MSEYKELQPRIVRRSKNLFVIEFWYAKKRWRFSTGKPINKDLSPNRYPEEQRERYAHQLSAIYTLHIGEGWRPDQRLEAPEKAPNCIELAQQGIRRRKAQRLSKGYIKDLERTHKLWTEYCINSGIESLSINDLSIKHLRGFLLGGLVPQGSLPHLKRNLSSLLFEEAQAYDVQLPLHRIKISRNAPVLHKPIEDVSELLNDIQAFNENLHLCCIITYGMLLRPHREIRCLTFSDFNEDYTMVSLSGKRVKSKQNRVIPVPDYIRKLLLMRAKYSNSDDANIFTLESYSYNESYFKTLWGKYKKQSTLLKEGQTLYSFRHTGAIRVFEKSGSLVTLQRVMGHSDMKVSLIYLRGLEVKQLDIEDLPDSIHD